MSLISRRRREGEPNSPASTTLCRKATLSIRRSLKSTKAPDWMVSTTFPGTGGRAEDRTSGWVLDGPRLANGVASSVAREGGAPAGDKGC